MQKVSDEIKTTEDEGQKRQNNAARELFKIPDVQKRLAENDTAGRPTWDRWLYGFVWGLGVALALTCFGIWVRHV
jgi:hypothetical protein